MTSPRVRATDPVTSREGAGSVARSPDWRVLAMAVKLGVFHDGLLAQQLDRDRNIVARRRLELEEAGLVERVLDRDGRPVTAIGNRGVPVLTFRVTDEGIMVLRQEIDRRKQCTRST